MSPKCLVFTFVTCSQILLAELTLIFPTTRRRRNRTASPLPWLCSENWSGSGSWGWWSPSALARLELAWNSPLWFGDEEWQFLLWGDCFYSLCEIFSCHSSSDIIFSICFHEGKVGPRMFKSVFTSMTLLSHYRLPVALLRVQGIFAAANPWNQNVFWV